jgi:selenoprotein W-related protein
MKHKISIEYCPKCHWLLRAAYMAQEFLNTFSEEISELSLIPSEISGKYAISVNGTEIFDRKTNAGFEEIKVLKQMLRDHIAPEKDLGHTDKK